MLLVGLVLFVGEVLIVCVNDLMCIVMIFMLVVYYGVVLVSCVVMLGGYVGDVLNNVNLYLFMVVLFDKLNGNCIEYVCVVVVV